MRLIRALAKKVGGKAWLRLLYLQPEAVDDGCVA